jgi:hypothetical protein
MSPFLKQIIYLIKTLGNVPWQLNVGMHGLLGGSERIFEEDERVQQNAH